MQLGKEGHRGCTQCLAWVLLLWESLTNCHGSERCTEESVWFAPHNHKYECEGLRSVCEMACPRSSGRTSEHAGLPSPGEARQGNDKAHCVVSSWKVMWWCYCLSNMLVLSSMRLGDGSISDTRLEPGQGEIHSSDSSKSLFTCLLFALRVCEYLLVCADSIVREIRTCVSCSRDAEMLESCFALPSAQLLNCPGSFSSQKCFLSDSWVTGFSSEAKPALNRTLDQGPPGVLSRLVHLIPLFLSPAITGPCFG